jgi:hypothetical protein
MAIGLLKIKPPQHHWAVRAARWYASLTGSGVGYGFFSPNIPPQILMEFDIEAPDGKITRSTLQESAGSDVNLRLGNMMRMMMNTYKDKIVFRSMGASLDASMYKRYPEAKSITLHASIYDLPRMDEYRDGKRVVTTEVYSARFARRM